MKLCKRFLLSAFVCTGLSLFGGQCQASEPLKLASGKVNQEINQGRNEELHKRSKGKVTFMKDLIPIEDYSEKYFLSALNINNSKNFYFRTFLSKPLTGYLHELAPDLSIEELSDNGNYQFSFYVDERLIYKENLNISAGLPDTKANETIMTRPFFSAVNEDSWGRFLWMRFMHYGGEDALTEGRRLLKIEIRPYIKTPDLKVGNIIADGQINIDVIKPSVSESQVAIQPIQPNSGWRISKGDYDIEKIRELNKKIAQNDFKKISSIVVIKNGALLLEEYFNGTQRSDLHDVRSVGKSFASSMLGIAINDGFIKNENQKINTFYDLKTFNNHSLKKEGVTLKNLLTMSSAFDGDDFEHDSPGNEENMYPTKNWVKFTLDLPMSEKRQPGKQWTYFTAGAMLLGDIIDKSVPNGLEKYAHSKLFEPLGIENYQWQYTPQKVANTAGGIQLRTLDFAKYGELYRSEGIWNNKQIISKKWVAASLAQQLKLPDDENNGYYGYLFWNKTYTVNERSYEVSYATGNGGNKIFIFKNIPIVIVITAKAYGQSYAHRQVDKMMQNYLLPAILNE